MPSKSRPVVYRGPVAAGQAVEVTSNEKLPFLALAVSVVPKSDRKPGTFVCRWFYRPQDLTLSALPTDTVANEVFLSDFEEPNPLVSVRRPVVVHTPGRGGARAWPPASLAGLSAETLRDRGILVCSRRILWQNGKNGAPRLRRSRPPTASTTATTAPTSTTRPSRARPRSVVPQAPPRRL